MDADDIHRVLKRDDLCGPIFVGVFPRDALVRAIKDLLFGRKTFVAVFNSHAIDQPGEHWMAIYAEGRKAYYFDSYGGHPDIYPDVYEALRDNFDSVKWNENVLQGITTTACGDYCVLFCLLMSRAWTFDEIIERFEEYPNAERRDHAVRATLIALYGSDAYASIRNKRRGLSGVHSLHVDTALDSIVDRLFASAM